MVVAPVAARWASQHPWKGHSEAARTGAAPSKGHSRPHLLPTQEWLHHGEEPPGTRAAPAPAVSPSGSDKVLIPRDVPATHRALVGVFAAASAPREHPCKINGAQQQVSTPFSFSASDLGFDRSSHSPSVCLTSTIIYSAELDTFQTSYYTTVCSNTNICSVAQQQFC